MSKQTHGKVGDGSQYYKQNFTVWDLYNYINLNLLKQYATC